VSGLRAVATVDGPKSHAGSLVRVLLELSLEFSTLWEVHEVGVAHSRTKQFRHPVVGDLDLYCQLMDDRDQQQTLLVFTATPGSESAEKLQLLSVLGTQQLVG